MTLRSIWRTVATLILVEAVISINPARIPQAPTKLRIRLGNGTNQHMIVLASGHEVRNAEASEK